MKARLLLDQFADITKVTEAQRAMIKPVSAFGRVDYIFPEGTIFEGDQAVFMCKTGQCEPCDDECAAALNLSAHRRAALQVNYKMNSLGINSPEDRKLYQAGVILGYDDKLDYIPGPNWAAYKEAEKKLQQEKDDI